jgi:phosphate transport system substrate-binding protein
MQGTIKISGAWALYPMVVQWAEVFQQKHPGVRIDVSAGGAGKGATDALSGLVDIGMVSRDIHPEEINKGGFWVSVVKDSVFPMVNEKNPVLTDLLTQGVKKQAFIDLWITGKTKTWGQVVGSKDAHEVHVYTRSDACGAAETWAKYLGQKQENLKGVAVYGDPGLAEAIRKDPLGLGYNNLNYAFDAKTGQPVAGLCVVPLDINSNGKLDPDENFYEDNTKEQILDAVRDGRYPSPPARYLNFLTKGKPQGLVREFIMWTLEEGQEYAPEAGYVPLPEDKVQESIQKLD